MMDMLKQYGPSTDSYCVRTNAETGGQVLVL